MKRRDKLLEILIAGIGAFFSSNFKLKLLALALKHLVQVRQGKPLEISHDLDHSVIYLRVHGQGVQIGWHLANVDVWSTQSHHDLTAAASLPSEPESSGQRTLSVDRPRT